MSGHRLTAALRVGTWLRSLRREQGALPDAVGHQRLGRPPGGGAGATPATGAILADLEAPLVASYRPAKHRRAGAPPRPARLPSMLAVTADTGSSSRSPSR